MLKKRIVGVITIKDGWAVQSFGYNRYLPLGKPEVLAENLDRWGADEIVLQCINQSRTSKGPDYETLTKVAEKGLSTPLIYAGGVSTADEGMRVVQAGADRVVIDALLHSSPETVSELATFLGAQALIGSIPVSIEGDELFWFDYQNKKSQKLNGKLLDLLQNKVLSEVILIDWKNEGKEGGFDIDLIHKFPLTNVPLIAFGGLSTSQKISEVLSIPSISAVAIGNFLNYQEHSIGKFKQKLSRLPIRMSYGSGV